MTAAAGPVEASPEALIVDDDQDLCGMLSLVLSRGGFDVRTTHDGNSALSCVNQRMPDVMLLDVRMPGPDGMEVLRRVHSSHPQLPVVMMTSFAGVSQAVEAIKAGAADYLAKPFDNRHAVSVLKQVVKQAEDSVLAGAQASSAGTQAHTNATKATSLQSHLRATMGSSPRVQRLVRDMAAVAESNFSVIIQGETGTGKELVARTLHTFSARSEGPFIAVDCGAIAASLLESELFGHEKGAFTSADSRSIGKFEAAAGGTLFLDEIGNMPLQAQASMLRVLQERVLYRVGGQQPIKIDCRVLVATHEDLQQAVEDGRFREDLWYRLNEFQLCVPPLRERREDILHLAEQFRRQAEIDLAKPVPSFSAAAQQRLLAFDWPGNVRELRAVVRRAALLAEEQIDVEHIRLRSRDRSTLAADDAPVSPAQALPVGERSMREILLDSKQQLERALLGKAMGLAHGNKAEAARLLQVDYKTIHNKLKQFGLQHQ
ncbi:MAG: sigma-54 dependent transcriptional regulator [Chromatiaceae bacterium]|nr:sigma-54 dependent transcriptional regulator [Chromatiaceae bacterium]MCF8017169.1 sigma-54 dependent transcriptional regulator [Chromatiaceae bacterium]